MAEDTIMALDLATVTGLAWGGAGSTPLSISHRIAAPGTELGPFLHRFGLWLNEQISVLAPGAVIYEAPILTGDKTSIDTAMKLICLAGLADMICFRRGIKPWRADSSEVCKFFTGRGRYGNREEKKAAVKETCRRLGWSFQDDNGADALALWSWAEFKLFPAKHKHHGGLWTPPRKASA